MQTQQKQPVVYATVGPVPITGITQEGCLTSVSRIMVLDLSEGTGGVDAPLNCWDRRIDNIQCSLPMFAHNVHSIRMVALDLLPTTMVGAFSISAEVHRPPTLVHVHYRNGQSVLDTLQADIDSVVKGLLRVVNAEPLHAEGVAAFLVAGQPFSIHFDTTAVGSHTVAQLLGIDLSLPTAGKYSTILSTVQDDDPTKHQIPLKLPRARTTAGMRTPPDPLFVHFDGLPHGRYCSSLAGAHNAVAKFSFSDPGRQTQNGTHNNVLLLPQPIGVLNSLTVSLRDIHGVGVHAATFARILITVEVIAAAFSRSKTSL